VADPETATWECDQTDILNYTVYKVYVHMAELFMQCILRSEGQHKPRKKKAFTHVPTSIQSTPISEM